MGGDHATVRAGREPALDGVRALAVLAVMLFHANVSWARGGYLGVDTFFVLSGFLITRLLLEEHTRTGRLDLPAFWARRMRRLLPALLLLIGAITIAFVVRGGESATIRSDVASTVAYFANWRRIFAGSAYFKQVGAPSPFDHTWSLAIEEQFYLVWPVLMIGLLAFRARRAAVATFAAVGAVASAVVMTLVVHAGADPSRAYFGTDTRAQSILIGVALAAVLRRGVRERRIFTAVAFTGLAGTAVAWTTLASSSSFLYHGGFATAGIAAAAVIAGVSARPRGVVARALGVAPLQALGRISYGVYLWHWPLQLAITHKLTGLTGPALIIVRMIATIGVAAASFVFVEEPIRRAKWEPARTIPGFAAAGIAMVAAVALVFAPPSPVGALVASPFSKVVIDPVRPRLALATAAPVVRARAVVAAKAVVRPVPYPPHSVAFFGDSVSMSLAQGSAPVGPPYGVNVLDDAILGCGVARSGDYKLAGTTYRLAWECAQWDTEWSSRVTRDRPDVVAILVGRHEVLDRVYKSRWTNILDDSYAAYVQDELEHAIAVGSSNGARVALLTAPFYRSRERPDGGSWPENDPARVRRLNAIERAVAAHHPGVVRLIELGDRVDPGGSYAYSVDGAPMRSDGVHFSAAACRWLAPWLLPQFYALGAQGRVTPPRTPSPSPSPRVTTSPTPSPEPTATNVPVP